MPKTAKRANPHSSHHNSLSALPNIGPGSANAMAFRALVDAGAPWSTVHKVEREILAKPVNDFSDLQSIAEIAAWYIGTEREGLAETAQNAGPPDNILALLVLAVRDLAKKKANRLELA